MFAVIGLGNPGDSYARTRHNAGVMAAEFLQQQWQSSQQFRAFANKRMQARGWVGNQLVVAVPTTYMNESGIAVQALLKWHHLDPAHVIVAFDDLDLTVGTQKIQFAKGPKVHNGLRSIYDHLGTDQFWHWRLGIDGRAGQRRGPGADYVLSSFSADEKAALEQCFTAALPQLAEIVST